MALASQRPIHALALMAGTAALGVPARAAAQGCEPIRFTTPNAVAAQMSRQAGEWRLTLGYRRLKSDQWFIGSEEASGSGPGGQSPVIKVHTFVADLAYAATDRLTVRLAVPFSVGDFTRVYPDGAPHDQEANGLGDMTLSGELLLLGPGNQNRNVAVGLGLTAPTGSNETASQFYTATGPVAFPADQAIQPGGGGWGLTVMTRSYAKLAGPAYGYLSASYTVTPEAESDVYLNPGGPLWGIADGYSGRLGVSYTVATKAGLVVSMGGRIDGTPVRDLIGGGSELYRRPGYVVYADPAVGMTLGANDLSLNVPLRLYAKRQRSIYEEQNGGINGGGFAKSLIFLTWSRRL